MEALMPQGIWLEPQEPPGTQSRPSQRWAGFLVSALGHGLLIGGLLWAGQQWVPLTPPEPLEVMLFELPTVETPAPVKTAEVPKTPAIKPTPAVKPSQPAPKEAIKPANSPAPTPAADIALGPQSTPAQTTPSLAPQEPSKAAPTKLDPVSSEVSPPRVDARYASSNPRPVYPSMARRLGQEGTVVLEVIVATDGSAKSVRIQESSGFELLDQAALQAISRWKFVPGKRGEVPFEQKLSTRWTYKLEQ